MSRIQLALNVADIDAAARLVLGIVVVTDLLSSGPQVVDCP